MKTLEIEKISKTYQGPTEKVLALREVSVSADKGEFVAVAGPSGCGKTTLLLAAGTLLRPSGGHVQICGEDAYAMSPEARARFRAGKIGFVFQQFCLVPYLTVLENVMAPSVAKALPNAKERAMSLIRKFQLEDRQNHVPSALSTGERQRTALARALLHEPELILADEPTGNLDKENSDIVLGYLADLAKEGRAVLMVTHDESALAKANRTVRLEKARSG